MSLRVHTYWRGLRICAQCSGPMDACRADAEVCSGTCGRARRRARQFLRNGGAELLRTLLPAEGGVVAAERERARLAKRASRDVDADRLVLGAAVGEVRSTPYGDLELIARLGGRIQKTARRLIAHRAYVERYGDLS